jgi:lipopolysaccharide biosynthesis regulator YciM
VWELSSTAERILQLRHIVRRETVCLVILTTIASAAFVGTRALAQRAERLAVQDAAAWYARGQGYLAESNAEDAAVAFRRATMKHRGEKRYVLALADALARSAHPDPAVRALLGLRELSPEDVDVNLALARLARTRNNRNEAIRYYQHAIYAPAATAASSRHLRVELVGFLLETDQLARANSELIAASIDLPDDPSVRIELADLFLRAGNAARAAEQYRLVLERDRTHLGALEGAVRAAFALGDYRGVAEYRLPDTASDDALAHLAVARAVVARDPLASRLASAERRRRLLLNISYIESRWKQCQTAQARPSQYPTPLLELRAAARRAAIGRDTEALEAGMATIDRLRQELAPLCQTVTPIDRALIIIVRSHDIGT